jgi:hypothetical protein
VNCCSRFLFAVRGLLSERSPGTSYWTDGVLQNPDIFALRTFSAAALDTPKSLD